MEWPRDGHTEWSESNREGEIPCDIPYMRNLKKEKKPDEHFYKTERLTNLENELMVAGGKVRRKG